MIIGVGEDDKVIVVGAILLFDLFGVTIDDDDGVIDVADVIGIAVTDVDVIDVDVGDDDTTNAAASTSTAPRATNSGCDDDCAGKKEFFFVLRIRIWNKTHSQNDSYEL